MAAEKRAKKPTPSQPHRERGKEHTPPPRPETHSPSDEEQERTEAKGGFMPAFEFPAVLKELTATTSRVVVKAATILEEEIAAGIVAAKQMEERFVNVTKARSGKPDEIMQRFRRDAHEAVDIMIDLIGAASSSIDRLADTSISLGGPEPREKAEKARGVPMLAIPHPVKAGASATIEMMLENDQDKATDEFSFYSSDLVSAKGDRIAASAVTFKPHSLRIGPRKSSKVAVSIKVPGGTPDGSYSGLVQATNLKQLKAVLVVPVQSE